MKPSENMALLFQDQKSEVLEGNEQSEGTRDEMIRCTVLAEINSSFVSLKKERSP